MSVDEREMEFWVADANGNRFWKTARGSAAACWAALGALTELDPLTATSAGYRVLRCSGKAIESDLRYHQVPEAGGLEK